MSDEELVTEYLLDNYAFSVNVDGWCVYDKYLGKKLIPLALYREMGKVFPYMNTREICMNWYNHNRSVMSKKIHTYLSDYRLVDTGGRFTWEAISRRGHKFKLEKLMETLPEHFDYAGVRNMYDEWFEHEKYVATNILVNNPKIK